MINCTHPHLISLRWLWLLIVCIGCTGTPSKNSQASGPPSEADLGDLYQYYQSSPSNQQERDENAIIEFLAQEGIGADRVGSGIYIIIERLGDGEPVRVNDIAVTHYEGAFLDGQVFDSSYKKQRPLVMGVYQGIKGWQEAHTQLRVGGKCTVYIPSTLGYGTTGFPPIIPANKNLKFVFEILDVNPD